MAFTPRSRIREHRDDSDPLALAIAPPPDESPGAKEARQRAEKAAKLRSDTIDEELNRQRLAEKKMKCVRILLLGKSTTLKNFQLIHSSKAFKTERASWRAVVQLNVVRSMRLILDAMAEAHASSTPRSSLSSPHAPSTPEHTNLPALTPELLKLKMRLLPLQKVEEALLRKLSPTGDEDREATHLSPVTNLSYSGRAGNEVAVNSSSAWKGAFSRLLNSRTSTDTSHDQIDFDNPNDPGVILHACSEDMIRLWEDPTVKKLLTAQRIRLEDMAGFFLDSLERVTSPKYVPTDDDILRARLKTLGVSEHRFKLQAGNMLSHDWRIFDVGGARSLRAAWIPFFDDMDAIIFLAPISCFDQVLAEDSSVNRLEDSILLWRSVVSNPLLKKTNIVLFLNKIDILKAKLASGVQFGHYVVSYGERPNDFESTASYLKKKFGSLHKSCSPATRTFYSHLTAVTDVKSTQHILRNVKDMVVRQSLKAGDLM
ncbi:G-alpha-domain-containing protein [Pluteus cervinus]|uniref:G-alpha-domain-containing protein n=1 Tax=Pluteus cervinus TaxID=181527 RepID=A0ACD3BA78_9AGAR|nr:G-alpha-domain-containing protein [Pluteus cervinus]